MTLDLDQITARVQSYLDTSQLGLGYEELGTMILALVKELKETRQNYNKVKDWLYKANNERVNSVENYCHAFETWAKVMVERDIIEEADFSNIRFALRKSNLAYRLIYGGEKLRTRECPIHKGKWSGCSPEECPAGCSYGADVTGWLPEEMGVAPEWAWTFFLGMAVGQDVPDKLPSRFYKELFDKNGTVLPNL